MMDRNALCDSLDRVSLGDRQAFDRVYAATSAKLFGIVLGILPNRAEAQEALQECYLNVWRRAGSYDRTRAGAMAWLIAVARNAAIDRARKRRDQPVGDDALAALPAGERSPEQNAIASGEARQLHSCLETLPARESHPVRTAYMNGLSYSQVAVATGRPLGTIKSTIRRSLAKLRMCLKS